MRFHALVDHVLNLTLSRPEHLPESDRGAIRTSDQPEHEGTFNQQNTFSPDD